MSIENYNDTIGYRTRDLPAFSAVSQTCATVCHPEFVQHSSDIWDIATESFRMISCALCFPESKHLHRFMSVQ
jgi:hypothetical protein